MNAKKVKRIRRELREEGFNVRRVEIMFHDRAPMHKYPFWRGVGTQSLSNTCGRRRYLDAKAMA